MICVGLCLEFAPPLCRTYDITIAALPLYSVIALRAQSSSAVKNSVVVVIYCQALIKQYKHEI